MALNLNSIVKILKRAPNLNYFNLKIGAKLEFNFKILKLAPNVNFILKFEKARNLDFLNSKKMSGNFNLIF